MRCKRIRLTCRPNKHLLNMCRQAVYLDGAAAAGQPLRTQQVDVFGALYTAHAHVLGAATAQPCQQPWPLPLLLLLRAALCQQLLW